MEMTVATPSDTSLSIWTRRDPSGQQWPLIVKRQPGHAGRLLLEIDRGDAGVVQFGRYQDLADSVHQGTYRTWSLNRYAGLGLWDRPSPETGLVLSDVPDLVLSHQAQSLVIHVPSPVGIDLERRSGEVAKLLGAGFGGQIAASNYEFNDVLQEVYRKLLAANRGKSPWDARKSSFGHYVYMVCRSALYNFHRRQARQTREQLGIQTYQDGQAVVVDAREAKQAVAPKTDLPDDALASLSRHLIGCASDSYEQALAALAIKMLPHLAVGKTRSEIVQTLALKPKLITLAFKFLQEHASHWRY